MIKMHITNIILPSMLCTTRVFNVTYAGYAEFGKHLKNTGRPMIYSCSWPAYQEGKGMLVSTHIIAVRIYF